MVTKKVSYNWFVRILPAVEEKIRRVVRDVRAKDPLIRVAGLKDVLENISTAASLTSTFQRSPTKLLGRGLMEADRTQVEQRMQFARENYRMMCERLLKIVYRSR
jgi:hypothetical protein